MRFHCGLELTERDTKQDFVTDVDGNEVFSRISFQNNTLYKDTLTLDPGCYKIELIDTDHDGLNFFANNDGAGYFQIRKPSGAPLAGFDSDFWRSNYTLFYGGIWTVK